MLLKLLLSLACCSAGAGHDDVGRGLGLGAAAGRV
jgi:hypothetical protein